MRNPRDLTSKDIAEDLVRMHNHDPAHDELLKEVNAYFQHNINELKRQANSPNPNERPQDLRGEVIALFKNVEVQTSFDQREGPKAPYHVDFLDVDSQNGKSIFRLNESPANRNIIPSIFQYSDAESKLSFSIKTNGDNNADYLYQEMTRQGTAFPSVYKTWSQFWGGGTTANTPPYQPGRQGKTKYEF